MFQGSADHCLTNKNRIKEEAQTVAELMQLKVWIKVMARLYQETWVLVSFLGRDYLENYSTYFLRYFFHSQRLSS